MNELADADEPAVYRLADDCTRDDLEEGAYYEATVDGVVDYGVFVQLSAAVSGLVHESVYEGTYEEGDDIVVELTAIKDNGDLSFVPVEIDADDPILVEHEYDSTPIHDLTPDAEQTVHIEGEIIGIKQTGGPTLFQVSDGTGVIPCAAFEAAGVRAHPDINIGDAVVVVGTVERRDDGQQLEVDGITRLTDDEASDVHAARDAAIRDRSAPHEVDPLVDWPALASFFPELERIAEDLRRAVHDGRPVVIRHHADTDGMCASIPVALALEHYVQAIHADTDAARHLVKRLPSRAPYYEMEDVTRDLSHALSGQERHGQKLPLLLMIDNGSTAEDVPAYKQLETYDIPVIVIDHHHPDHEAVAPYVKEHVNPYNQGEDYRITAGMLCVELARMIDPDITDAVQHVPAVAGLADRSGADAMADYFALAEEAGFDQADCEAIGDAMDYAAYWLRYDEGFGVTRDLLDLAGDGPHGGLVETLSRRAAEDIERQLEAALEHVETERLDNDVRLCRVDVDKHAYRFTYPAPGTTTGAIHDRMVAEYGEPVITIGYGPDFAVLRSDGVRLDIPEMVSELNDELAGAGVSGGGHLVVGSIRFVSGMREPVLERLVEKMTAAEIDESLGAAAVHAPFDQDA